ncbi:MAG: YwqG family protein [Phycisphaeraceae bacterium]
MTRDEACALLRELPEAMAMALEGTLEEAVAVESRLESLDRLAIGASRFSGTPDVPEGFEWPETEDGRALVFLAQINLEEVAQTGVRGGLPGRGWLYFFKDVYGEDLEFNLGLSGPDGPDTYAVRYHDVRVDELKRIEDQAQHPDDEPSPCRALGFRKIWTLYFPGSDGQLVDFGQADQQDVEQIQAINEILQSLLERLTGYPRDQKNSRHWLLGRALGLQPLSDVLLEAANLGEGDRLQEELVGLTQEEMVSVFQRYADRWRLLFQIDTEYSTPNWTWGDCGRLFFAISVEDLENGIFDRCVCVEQST